MSQFYTSCPICGGDLLGDGYRAPVVCENREEVLGECLEPDSGPHYCEPEAGVSAATEPLDPQIPA